MPIVRFVKTRYRELTLPVGVSLMEALLEAGMPVASSCGGEGICRRCIVAVALTAAPSTAAPSTALVNAAEVLACQTTVEADILCDTPYW